MAVKLAFGISDYVDSVVARIEQQLRAPIIGRDPSLVVGVFGPWGSGKTTVLRALQQRIEGRADETPNRATVCVWFNPWRYEREEHLIVPLLKTAEIAVGRASKKPVSEAKQTRAWLKQRAELLGDLAVAVTYGMKLDAEIPLVGKLSLDPGKMFEEANKRWWNWKKKQEPRPTKIASLQSQYYDFHLHLQMLTGRADRAADANAPDGDASKQLNLVFFIDDLDRCLPDKAVEMLEAIKLFLETEGCAFVLALDDEVIERGIAHRYRDYAGTNGSGRNNGTAPISGTEYLEKIIHLPFRIPLPRRDEVEDFLQAQFPALFAPVREQAEPRQRSEQVSPLAPEKREDPKRTALLQLFSTAIPHVPRKLIRVAELLTLLLDVAKQRGWSEPDVLTLARMTILQVLAPELYRFGSRNRGFIKTLENWSAEPGWLTGRWLGQQIAAIEERLKEVADPSSTVYAERTELPLLRMIETSLNNRSSFDPRNLVQKDFPSEDQLHRYFSLAADVATVVSGVAASGSATVGGRDAVISRSKALEARTVRVRELDTFLAQLLSGAREQWLNALGAEELQGAWLDDTSFGALLAAVRTKPEAVSVDLLEALASYVNADQFMQLYQASDILKRLAATAAKEN